MKSETRPSISLCMIVRNEAHQLAGCLDPVAGLFDEIVIVDTGSRDNTRQVAQQFTQQVYDFPWYDDFSAARNESLRHANGDWIFWLDADDRLSPDNVVRLSATLGGLPACPAVFFMDTVCASQNVGDPERLISHPRLFSRHPQLRWTGRVHEQLRPWPASLGFKIVSSDVQVQHTGYSDSALSVIKCRRDLRLLRMDFAIDPNEPMTLLHLGQVHAHLGQATSARKYLSRLLEIEQRPLPYMRRVFSTLCDLALVDGLFQQAVSIANQALNIFPGDPHISYLLAEALYELEQYAAAEHLLIDIMNRPISAGYHVGTPNQMQRKLAPRSLGEVLRIQGANTAAESILKIVVREFPDDTMSWHALGRVYIDLNDFQKLEEVRAAIETCQEGRVYSLLLLAAWHLLKGDLDDAEPVIDELIALAPQLPLPRIMRAIWLDRHNALPAARLQAYRDVLRVQPNHTKAREVISQLEASLRTTVVSAELMLVNTNDLPATAMCWASATV